MELSIENQKKVKNNLNIQIITKKQRKIQTIKTLEVIAMRINMEDDGIFQIHMVVEI